MIDKSDVQQVIIGGAGVGVGFIDQVVNIAQIISVVGGAIIIIITLFGMAIKAFKDTSKKLK